MNEENKTREKESLSVVMPVYNEAAVIGEVIRSFHREVLVSFDDWEFIIVDDCSTDTTVSILEELAKEIPLKVIHLSKNSGHGTALITAINQAKNHWVFHCDSDNQFYAADFWLLWKPRERYDILLGYRHRRLDPPLRMIISRLLALLNLLLFGVYLKDANSPFKLMRSSLLEEILPLIPPGAFAPSIMISVLSHRLGKRLLEIPVRHLPRTTGRTSLIKLKLLRACLQCAGELVSLKLGYRRRHF